MTPTPTGRVETTEVGRDLILERVLPGSIDDAWASLTESDRLARWYATWTGDARVGGTVTLSFVAEEGDATSEAQIVACDPPTHLAVRTQDQGSTWLLEATLTALGPARTQLRFVHHLDAETNAEEVGPGWEYYLDRLAAALAGEAMPDWDDYWPGLAAAYA